jgi:hypothetical protein
MSVEPTGYGAFDIKKVKGYSDGDFNLVYWLSELYAVKYSGEVRMLTARWRRVQHCIKIGTNSSQQQRTNQIKILIILIDLRVYD